MRPPDDELDPDSTESDTLQCESLNSLSETEKSWSLGEDTESVCVFVGDGFEFSDTLSIDKHDHSEDELGSELILNEPLDAISDCLTGELIMLGEGHTEDSSV